jgi:DNA-binding MarR family transcriptional regulator
VTVYFSEMPRKTSVSRTQSTLARHVWRLMFDFLMRTAPQRAQALGKRGLTPNDSRALASLGSGGGRSMRSLAEEWGCDASNATWMVDRLEKLGLAERRSTPRDRRVKEVFLTEKGMRTKADLLQDFHAPPPELAALPASALKALEAQLAALSNTVAGPPPRE